MGNATASASASSGGIGFVGLLTIVLIALKLTGHITISWIWVFSPIWISILLLVALVALIFVIAVVAESGGKNRR